MDISGDGEGTSLPTLDGQMHPQNTRDTEREREREREQMFPTK